MSRTFYVVPHTHWDREWYRPFEYFQLRLAHVVDGVLDVLERDPEFISFTLDGQAIVLEDYVEVRPLRTSEVGSGRWWPTGESTSGRATSCRMSSWWGPSRWYGIS